MLHRLSRVNPSAMGGGVMKRRVRDMSSDNKYFQSLVGVDVHGRTDDFRNRPLFRRGGKDRKFKTGEEAASLLIKEVIRREPNNREFARDVELIARYLAPVFDRDPKYAWAMKHLVEPERVIQFRVPWIDRDGNNRINRGIRVQHSSSLGPMLGGIRLDKDCNINILRTLAFNQTLQNSLTGYQLGGSFGGSDFDPHNKTSTEIRGFCWAFITDLHPHIGSDRDIICRDLGVGDKAIGYLFGRYKRLTREYAPVFAGKDMQIGGSHLASEGAGYGLVYFADEMLRKQGGVLPGSRCAVSGSGQVALAAVEKLLEFGAVPVSISDSSGILYYSEGITASQLARIKKMKMANRNTRLSEIVSRSSEAIFFSTSSTHSKSQWESPAYETFQLDYVFPCASENEVSLSAAEALISRGVRGVFEGANMPCEPRVLELFKHNQVLYAPGIAANAGGMVVNALEIQQNVQRQKWSEAEVDAKLRKAMKEVYGKCSEAAEEYGLEGDIAAGAFIASFVRVADAMLLQGVV